MVWRPLCVCLLSLSIAAVACAPRPCIRGLPPVPRAFFLVWAALLARFDLPPEGLVILLAVDPLIDMARTIVNVGGNCLAVVALDRWEKGSEEQQS